MTPRSLKDKAERLRNALDVLIGAIDNGGPTEWKGSGNALQRHWAKVGVKLISRTRAEKKGLVLKRGAKPLLFQYFGAPIQNHVALYDETTQFLPKKPGVGARSRNKVALST